ncbi:hypothetical protein AB833_04305 [Chromatiales bacterium (ex Bugula neritina AB1)]|nr:hypothetical protein AB833_04305 [Chromatiales bacterium (ex Bugula neritina AB1)]
MSFEQLGLSSPLLRALSDLNYNTPTAIQKKAVPVVLSGKDLLAAARTGTGKTAGYVLPLLQKLESGHPVSANQTRVLIIVPTRELASQVGDNIQDYSRYLNLKSLVVHGGVKINPQMLSLRKGVDILVATPGRLLDLHAKNAVGFRELAVLVLDEADRMLDLGFSDELREIISRLPVKRQTLLFSATFSPAIRKLAKAIVRNAVEIQIDAPNRTAEAVRHWAVLVDKKRKPALLLHLLKLNSWNRLLVFVRTKKGADRLVGVLRSANISSAAIHGDKSQSFRARVLEDFKKQRINVMVATDVAARGIDIDQLPQVVNFDLPDTATDYIHRVGRTARAGAAGEAVSLICADEHPQLTDIERLLQQLIRREYEPGFEPVHEVPPSRLDTRPIKPRKPKKNKNKNKIILTKKTQAKKTQAKKAIAKKFAAGREHPGKRRSKVRRQNNRDG